MTTNSASINKSAYWDSFYAKHIGLLDAPRYPSQFAAFVANELANQANCGMVIEFGCGNGRDSEFFANCGFNVVAMDASGSAIKACIASARGTRVKYLQKDVSEARECIVDVIKRGVNLPVIAIYARFFLHAITEKEQSQFIEMLGTELPSGAFAFFEYRTDGDELDRKEFGNHYRRFQPHKLVLQALESSGFEVEYEIEGKGLAKYKSEDALVGRCIARKR